MNEPETFINNIHPNATEISRLIYQKMKAFNTISLEFEDDIYVKFSRAFASLEAKGYISQAGALGRALPIGITVENPAYIIALSRLFEEAAKIEKLINAVENCKVGAWLIGRDLQRSIGIPLPVVVSVFEEYEAKGYGLMSQEIGNPAYYGKS